MAKFKKKNNKTIFIAIKGFSRQPAGLKHTLPAFHKEQKKQRIPAAAILASNRVFTDRNPARYNGMPEQRFMHPGQARSCLTVLLRLPGRPWQKGFP